jgi:hypothetical protein
LLWLKNLTQINPTPRLSRAIISTFAAHNAWRIHALKELL